VNYLAEKNEFLLDIPEEGTGFVVLRNDTIVEEPEPPIIKVEEVTEIVEEELNETKILFLWLIILSFSILMLTIAFIVYKNYCSGPKV
jgi:hypothetical protein